MRHLFSNFASGSPALGLLLIRIAAGTSLIVNGAMRLHTVQPGLSMIVGALEIVDGAMLVAGVWTPFAGCLAIALSAREIHLGHENLSVGILLAAMGAGLALVGPGAFSLDAWMFGLKRIDIEKLNGAPRR